MAATLLRRADARAESQLVVRQTRARPDNKNYQLWCAVSPGYGWLVAARCMVGLGEASFINLAAPFINAVAPRESRSAWLAIFYATIPVGIALGYAYGGLVTGQLGLSWRWALAIQAIIMAPQTPQPPHSAVASHAWARVGWAASSWHWRRCSRRSATKARRRWTPRCRTRALGCAPRAHRLL